MPSSIEDIWQPLIFLAGNWKGRGGGNRELEIASDPTGLS